MKKSTSKRKNKKVISRKKNNSSSRSDFSRILTLVLTNEDFEKAKSENREPVMKTVRLFGSNHHLVESNPDNIEVLESDYIHLKKYLLSNEMEINGFRVSFEDCEDVSKDENIQKSLIWMVEKGDVFGVHASYRIPVGNYFDEKQQVKNAIDVKPYKITVNGDTEIVVNVWNKIVITFYVKEGSKILWEFWHPAKRLPFNKSKHKSNKKK